MLCINALGEILAQAEEEYPQSFNNGSGVHEQSPEDWWKAASACFTSLAKEINLSAIATIAVDGTSGTLVSLDSEGNSVRKAIMYNDARSDSEAESLNLTNPHFTQKHGYQFSSSFALPKALWIKNNEPSHFEATQIFCHHADYLTGRLTGNFALTDFSNALKSGYDLHNMTWPSWQEQLQDKFGSVQAPGELIGTTSSRDAFDLGFSENTKVVSGVSDGIASCIASGMHRIGDVSITLGTTLVFKTLSILPVSHSDGSIYSHKLADKIWVPGAASNTGGEWIRSDYSGRNLAELDDAASSLLPTSRVAYPLRRQGERYPFYSKEFIGFGVGLNPSKEAYAACLLGTAFVARMGLEKLLDAIKDKDQKPASLTLVGGGSRSSVWMQLFADVCQKEIRVPAHPEAAFGSAIIAASADLQTDILSIAAKTVKAQNVYSPDRQSTANYEKGFLDWKKELSLKLEGIGL